MTGWDRGWKFAKPCPAFSAPYADIWFNNWFTRLVRASCSAMIACIPFDWDAISRDA